MAARAIIAAQTLAAPTLTFLAGAADITETAANVADGDEIVLDGTEVLIVHNTHAADAGTITIAAKNDPFGRTGSVNAYSVAAGKISVFNLRDVDLFAQATGEVHINCSAATMKVAALRVK